jgi:hypothetical protein
MTPSQILTQDAQNQGEDPQKVLQSALAQVNSGHTIMMQENNSVLLVTRLGDGRAMLHISTLDSPLTLRSSIKGFWKKLKGSEVKTVYGDTNNQQVIELMKKAGLKIIKSNLPRFTWMAHI